VFVYKSVLLMFYRFTPFFQDRGLFVDCMHKKTHYFHIFANFPFIFHAGPFGPEHPKCDYFFYNHLDYSHPVPNFFGVFIYQIPTKSPNFGPFRGSCDLKKKKIFKFFGSIWAEQPQRVKWFIEWWLTIIEDTWF